ncbi:winged helix DNA-binding domain-containing protein [Actinomadura flavalba]|uniref:winged helix DNA-binding domain-containing protein n=1 Tax=Actinomadura flavalba TaxID=1120938 RepID=UPI00037E9E80|nr:winged helix DNA-binding domain-containing protein [Actinomadura flavalba]
MTDLTPRLLNRATLARQGLLTRERVPAAEAVARFGGLQAQEPKPPFVGLWSRLDGFVPGDLHTALHAFTVVRSTMMRGTLHLVTASDHLAWRPLLQPVLDAGLRALGTRAEGLDLDAVLPVARDVFREPRTFTEARALLAAEFPAAHERALGFAARMCVPLVMVPEDGRWGYPRVARFTLAERHVAADGPGGSLDALVLRYLEAFGPASVRDAQAWSGLGGLGPVFDGLRGSLVTLRGPGGRELFDLPDAPRPAADVPAPVRLLPDFDGLVLAHDDRTRVIAAEHRPSLTTRNLRVRATFLVDGFVAGTWEAARKGRVASVRLRPFAPLGAGTRKELVNEAAALLRFTDPDAGDHRVEVDAP